MSEDKSCTYYAKETALHKGTQCNAKILQKEPVLSPEKMIEHISGAKNTMGGEIKEESPQYLYQCENGHILYRAAEWADVPTVSPGTIKSYYETINKPPKWYEG